MQVIRRLSLAVAMATAFSLPGHAAAPKEGQRVPQYEVVALDGSAKGAAAMTGKVTLVHFWATWCSPCREEMPALDKFYREHRQDGFEVLAISVEDAEDEAKVRELARQYAFPVAMKDNAKLDGFGRIWALPLSFLIDRKGVMRKVSWTGPEKIDAATLERLVLPLLAEH
jgi:cytochrome c biogenesis protein CcmG, thiol:disulfide interchange protein DsbE